MNNSTKRDSKSKYRRVSIILVDYTWRGSNLLRTVENSNNALKSTTVDKSCIKIVKKTLW